MYIDDNKWKELIATLDMKCAESKALSRQAYKLDHLRTLHLQDGKIEAYNDAMNLLEALTSPPIQVDGIKVLEVRKDPSQGLIVSMLCNGLEVVACTMENNDGSDVWLSIGKQYFGIDEWTPTMQKCAKIYYAEKEKERKAWADARADIIKRLA